MLVFFPSGRCWIFSCLNVMRLPFMKKFNIEEFEFSQSYLFFWDKVSQRYHSLWFAFSKTMFNLRIDYLFCTRLRGCNSAVLFLLCFTFSHCVNGKGAVNPLFVWNVLCCLDVCGPLCPLFGPSPWWYTPPDCVYFCFCLRWRGAIIFCMPVWRQPSGRSQ